MTTLRHKLGIRIKLLRIAKGFSQEEFADRCGFARTYMSRIETGGANPSLDALDVLATALDVDLKELLDFAVPLIDDESVRQRRFSKNRANLSSTRNA